MRTEKCVLCLKNNTSCSQSHNNHVKYNFNYDLCNFLLMRRCNFTRVTAVESRNAQGVLEQALRDTFCKN